MKKTFALAHFPYYQLDPDKGRGVEHFIKKYLEIEGNQVIIIRPDLPFFDIFFKIIRLIYKTFGKDYHFYRKKVILNYLSKSVNKKLDAINYDYIIAFGTLPLYNITSNKKIIMWSDATFQNILNYYNDYKNLSIAQINEFENIEKEVLKKTDYVCLTSSWATKTAIEHYKLPENKVFETPFGANLLDEVEVDIEDLKNKSNNLETLELLFIGKNWERKGGEKLFDLATKLKKKNINFKLKIIGCSPAIPENLQTNIKSYGLLDKRKNDENQLFNELLKKSHFFIMPSTAEAFGHVYCEANAYGIPAIGNKTGGVTSVILDNINGFTFNEESFVDDCFNYLKNIQNKNEEYLSLCLSSRKRYDEYLNWHTSIKKILNIIQ